MMVDATSPMLVKLTVRAPTRYLRRCRRLMLPRKGSKPLTSTSRPSADTPDAARDRHADSIDTARTHNPTSTVSVAMMYSRTGRCNRPVHRELRPPAPDRRAAAAWAYVPDVPASTAWAAARRATGTRKGEQLT